jgi:hypothetical protein
MKAVIIDFLDALIPLGIAILLLARPQTFTKKDLKAPENAKTAGLLKKAGFILLGAGILILISNLM